MNYKKLNKIRNDIDKIDHKLLSIIKKRTNLVIKVMRIKRLKKQIVDKKRIKKVLNNIKKNSIKKGIDPKITNKIWVAMINSYIDYEKRNFRKK